MDLDKLVHRKTVGKKAKRNKTFLTRETSGSNICLRQSHEFQLQNQVEGREGSECIEKPLLFELCLLLVSYLGVN